MPEPKRTKPRLSIVMSPARRALAEELAADRGLSLSVLLETLVMEEGQRRAAKAVPRVSQGSSERHGGSMKESPCRDVQVTAETGAVRVQVGDDALAWVVLTPTKARALAGVLEAVAAGGDGGARPARDAGDTPTTPADWVVSGKTIAAIAADAIVDDVANDYGMTAAAARRYLAAWTGIIAQATLDACEQAAPRMRAEGVAEGLRMAAAEAQKRRASAEEELADELRDREETGDVSDTDEAWDTAQRTEARTCGAIAAWCEARAKER